MHEKNNILNNFDLLDEKNHIDSKELVLKFKIPELNEDLPLPPLHVSIFKKDNHLFYICGDFGLISSTKIISVDDKLIFSLKKGWNELLELISHYITTVYKNNHLEKIYDNKLPMTDTGFWKIFQDNNYTNKITAWKKLFYYLSEGFYYKSDKENYTMNKNISFEDIMDKVKIILQESVATNDL